MIAAANDRLFAKLCDVLGRPDLGADPLELSGEALERLLVLLRRVVGGVRVVERLDHPGDRPLREPLRVDRLEGVAAPDRGVGVPEGCPERSLAARRPGSGRGTGAEGVAREEEATPREERDDGQRDAPQRADARAGKAGHRSSAQARR